MKQTPKNNNKIRPTSGALISFLGIIQTIFFIFIVGAAIYSGNFIFMAFVVAIIVIPAVKRFIQRNSQPPISEQGTGTSDDYSVINGKIRVNKSGVIWSRPLSDYDGVLLRKETSNFTKQSRNYTHQIIELRHSKNRAYDVNIYKSLEDVGVRARWEAAAKKFNLPALRDLGDGNILSRKPEDVGKSLQQLASEDALDISFSSAAPVPPGTRWTQHGRVLEVVQRREPWRCFLLTVPILLFYALIAYNLPFDVLFGNNDPAMRPVFRVIVYIPAVLIAIVWVRISMQIHISPNEVTVAGRLGVIPLWRKALPLDEVEEVLVDPSLVVWHSVLIESISSTLRVWPLNATSAQWLCQFLRSAIANAPDEDDSKSVASVTDLRE